MVENCLHHRWVMSCSEFSMDAVKLENEVTPIKDAMQDSKNSYLPRIVILLFFIRLGASQHLDEGYTSKTTTNLNGKETVHFSKELVQKPNAKGSPKYNMSSSEELNDVVTTRFRKEMAMLFSWLPENYQCKILLAVSKKTRCSVPSVIDLLFSLTELENHVNVSCIVKGKIKLKVCSSARKTFTDDVFRDELLGVFASLPAPFKCHVINTLALAYNPQRRRHLSFSLFVSQAQNAIANIFPSLSLPQTCAGIEMDHLIPSIPPVNITVNMAGVQRDSWLKTLTQKGPEVYKTVLKHEWETNRKGKMLGSSTAARYLTAKQEEINSAQLFIVGKSGSDKAFSVLFRLKVKRKQSHRLREMRSTYKIVQALGSKPQKELLAIFDANIISITLSGQKSNITKTPPKTNIWTLKQLVRAEQLFPAHLSEYYKQLGKAARCFIVLYISSVIKRSPKEAEMFYVSYNRVSRKHTCYYTGRKGPTDTPIIIHMHERFTARLTRPPLLKNAAIPTNASSIGSGTSTTNAVNPVIVKVHKEDMSSLEIGLFALLGLLCFVVLAFTVNCVLLALKANATFRKNNCSTKTALQTAVCHKGVTCQCGKDCVLYNERKKDDCYPAAMGVNTRNKPICNSSQLNASSASCDGNDRCKERTCQSQSCASIQSTSGGINRTNSRTHVENVYCVNDSPRTRTVKSSPATERDSAVKDSPKLDRSASKSECSISTRRELNIHSLKESQGKAISYCSISDANFRGQPLKVTQSGCLPTEQSHETVVVLLDCGGLKEAQV